MYKMVMSFVSLHPWKNLRPVPPQGECALGKVGALGVIRGSRGAGMDRMRVFGQWAFVYLVEGRGFYEDANGVSIEVGAGNWILVFPELPHRYGPRPGQRWDEFYICFEGPVFEEWRRAGILDATRPVGTLKPVSVWWRHFGKMVGEMEAPGGTVLEALTLWQYWLGRIMAGHEQPKGRTEAWLERAGRLLEQGLTEGDAGGREVAAALGMGYENFRKQFTRHMGVSPGKYRERLRMERAKLLLRGKRVSNKELAEILGYCDEAHFSKAFKRLAGMSPRAYSKSEPPGKERPFQRTH